MANQVRGRDSVSTTGLPSSTSANQLVEGSHLYTIKDYSLTKGMKSHKCMQSGLFNIGGYNWNIRLYTNTVKPENKSMYVSVYLVLASKAKNVPAWSQFTLLDQSGKGNHFSDQKVAAKFSNDVVGRGTKYFIERSELDNSDYLKDDCLVLRCTIVVTSRSKFAEIAQSIPVTPSNIGNSFTEFLYAGIGTDVVFQIGDETFEAHKLILAARCPIFQSMFFGADTANAANIERVVVEDMVPLVFKAMLHFIYSDSLPDLHEWTRSNTSWSSTKLAQLLLAAAVLYGLDRLKLLCEAKLSEELSSETVAGTLALAEEYSCYQLKSNCLKYVKKQAKVKEMMQSEGYKLLKESFPTLLSELMRNIKSDEYGLLYPKQSGSSAASKKNYASVKRLSNLFSK